MRVLITGGGGFIGSSMARRRLGHGDDVVIFDDFSRTGAIENVAWLRRQAHAHRLTVVRGDVRNAASLSSAIEGTDAIIHLASQTAVTRSLTDPRADFQINALGTVNVLEAARAQMRPPMVLYASTNKVYGAMGDLAVEEAPTRWVSPSLPLGIPEAQPLDFHSPYGCSKGAGDQYVRDYARIYGLRTVVFRQSCIYGPRQMGVEDQGWLAWFLIAALHGEPITVCGDGKQVRDVLFVDDLLDAYDAAIDRMDLVQGEVFNLGGGPNRTTSIWREFAPRIERLLGRSVDARFVDCRPGDQRVYVSDVRKAERLLGWTPRTNVDEGIDRLWAWVCTLRSRSGLEDRLAASRSKSPRGELRVRV